ncbi:SDR family oxidoreductase [Sphingobium sp. CR2-8]|uniref:SDR family NAD(P)-dependent oxidoreductase n=1 Tax=Sphingobium sp. CR2-8 TaxID=1306534 RepID=UPI002DBA306A|nr:SDR family oxidoreductase [Sphingobium sp. CR2-8]MEC3909631.1 SDR family oxidoreductase [Sphingobium sp. CR2-8]
MTASARLAGRRAIVTGASRGIGQAIATLFADEGARVLAVSRDLSKLQTAFDSRNSISTLAADMGTSGSAKQIVEAAETQLGGVDIVVNAAGLFEIMALEGIDHAHWDRTFAVNVAGPMALCTQAIPALRRSPAGRIINIGSVSVRLTQPSRGAYNASKHALTGLTLSLAVELGRYGITANVLHPGTIRTDMTRAILQNPKMQKMFEDKTAAGRVGNGDEIANAALYLADIRSGYTTGQTICVDGGYSAGVYDMGL